MVWIFIILFISINPCTNASVSHEFIAMDSCDIPGNDSHVNTLKGKLFESHFRNNASFYFSICGLSSNLSEKVFLAGYSDGSTLSLLATTISEVQKSPFEEFGFIAILSGLSTLVYAYLRCGHTKCFRPLIWKPDELLVFEVTTPLLCEKLKFLNVSNTEAVCMTIVTLVLLSVMFTVVVNKVVRGLSWTESIPLTSAVTVLGNKCRRRWRARRTQLSGPRYVRVRMDSPRASLKMNSPSVPLRSPVSTPPGSEFKIYDSDSQDEVLLDVKDEISLRN